MAIKQPAQRPAGRPAPALRRTGFFWSRLHFLIRFVGITGLLAACVGSVMAGLEGLLASWQTAYDAAYTAVTTYDAALSTWFVVGGAAAALFALLIEFLVMLRFTAGRRSVFGFNAIAQAALAAVLFVGINIYSFEHFLRFDWTRKGDFTLPVDLRTQLERLDPAVETTIVVYQRHKTFGTLTDKPDRYDTAAERKVVEKVKDLVEQFRELGGRFNVQVLEDGEEGFDDKLGKVAPKDSALREAIDRAPENSIFISAAGRVEQMSFNELFLLDRVASETDNNGRGNLVLLAQGKGNSGRGVEPFARKVLDLEGRKPRVGILVMHPLLTTTGTEDVFSLGGLRRSLEAHGFEVRDVVLRRMSEFGPPEPAADSPEESQLDEVDAELEDLDATIKALKTGIEQRVALVADWTLKPGEKEEDKLAALTKTYARELRGGKLTRKEQRESILAEIEAELARFRAVLEIDQKDRAKVAEQRAKLNPDALRESKRMSDVKAKLDRALADCDLLFIPRLTRRNNGMQAAPYSFHKLSEAQLASVREFIQAGKPILACLGPSSQPRTADQPPELDQPDGLDDMLAEFGVHLNKQTILFDADSKSFADRQLNPFQLKVSVKVPSLDFEAPSLAWRGRWAVLSGEPELPTNPIRRGLRVLAHSVGRLTSGKAGEDNPAAPERSLDIAIRFPRPISFKAPPGRIPAFDPTFLVTAEGWNDDNPYPTRGNKPHYEPPKSDDPANGTFDEKRRGQFPVGIAVEASLPEGWSTYPKKTIRLAVIGQGDVFVGAESQPPYHLPPAKERLFLQTANWLLGRDDYLPRDEHPWSYPRVSLLPSSREEQLWQWGTRLGLPVLFLYLGVVVLLVRRLR
jgi:hypothetical protein